MVSNGEVWVKKMCRLYRGGPKADLIMQKLIRKLWLSSLQNSTATPNCCFSKCLGPTAAR